MGITFGIDASHHPTILNREVGGSIHGGTIRVVLGHKLDCNAIAR
jgi:hypothetical protein